MSILPTLRPELKQVLSPVLGRTARRFGGI